MRMDSRPAVHLLVVLSFLLTCIVSVGQLDGQTPKPGNNDPFEASPLAQYSVSKPTPTQAPSSGLVGSTTNPLITRNVDLRSTLEKYAALKKCSLDEAFSAAVDYLRMVPIRDFSQSSQQVVGKQAIYKIVEKDIYQITASQSFFDNLSMHLSCLENGLRHIVLETRFLSIIPSEIESLQEFMIPDTFLAFTNKIPQAKPFATQASYTESQAAGKENSDAGTYVIATETKTKVHPSFMGRLNNDGLKRLLEKVKEMPSAEYTRPPRITIIPGQTASISDIATKPVVVGMDRVEGDFAAAHQPIVQTLENGSVLQLRATGEKGNIRLDGDLALGEVTSIGTFQYPMMKHDDGSPVFSGAPEFKLREVHWSTVVKEGQTVLIDPVFTKVNKDLAKEPETNRGRVNPMGRVVILVTPRFIDPEPRIRR